MEGKNLPTHLAVQKPLVDLSKKKKKKTYYATDKHVPCVFMLQCRHMVAVFTHCSLTSNTLNTVYLLSSVFSFHSFVKD